MTGSKRVVIVGMPGVGKTTVIENLMKIYRQRGVDAKHVVFGTVMMKEAAKQGIKQRDEIRRLPVERQRRLQSHAAAAISGMTANVLVVDTHLLISTSEGHWPGLPMEHLKTIAPTNLVLIEAKPSEIIARRRKDATRHRDQLREEDIERERVLALAVLGASGLALGIPLLLVENSEGRAEEAARKIFEAMRGG